MANQAIHVFFYPSVLGYSAYSSELDGIEADGKTLDELFQKVQYLIKVRIETLEEIGKEKEAEKLRSKEVIFLEK